MTKKDYIVLAGFMCDMKPLGGSFGQARWHAGVIALCDILKRDNPKFDAVRFSAACGIDPRGDMPLEMRDNYHKSDNVRKTEGEV